MVQEVVVHIAIFVDNPIVMATWREVVGDRLNMVYLTMKY